MYITSHKCASACCPFIPLFISQYGWYNYIFSNVSHLVFYSEDLLYISLSLAYVIEFQSSKVHIASITLVLHSIINTAKMNLQSPDNKCMMNVRMRKTPSCCAHAQMTFGLLFTLRSGRDGFVSSSSRRRRGGRDGGRSATSP